MNAAHQTNFEVMGLARYDTHQNAFTAVPPKGKDRPYVAPKKSSPAPSKVQQAAMALETPEERAARHQAEGARKLMDQQGRARVDLAPRTAGAITIHSQADAAKTTRIKRGRAI